MAWNSNSQYRIKENGRIVYVCPLYGNEYTVWGIGMYGFLHGAGAYLAKDTIKYHYYLIDESPYEEIERYFKLQSKFSKDD